MNRIVAVDDTVSTHRTIGQTAVVALVTSLTFVGGSVAAVPTWSVTSGVPVVGYVISLAATIAVVVGLPAWADRIAR
ncbi:hypothetical protein [Halovivax cerinus]|uniref:Uncharacterized protein n=1 Tax=Halovivax cerinus TaxID=1487865 RepID=A0ABD5NU89_9EURY|nr:hypothetical protein [Halovivax cerinus]